MMVLLLKGKKGYRGIGMVEVLWKVCSVVAHCCLEKRCHVARRPPWVQRGSGDGDGYLGGKADTEAGWDCTQ